MAADLGLVMDTAERHAHKLPPGGVGHAHGDAGLAGSRRSHQAEESALDVRGKLLHRQVLQDALLHLFQAKVLIVQDLAGLGQVHGLLGGLAPGQLQAGVQVAPQHRRLGGAKGLLLQAAQLLFQLLPHLVGHGQGLDPLAVLVKIVGETVLAQLGLDDLHLFPQIVLPLAAVHLLLGLLVELLLDAHHIDLPVQQPHQQRQAAGGSALLQQHLFVFQAEVDVLGQVIRHVGGIGVGQHVQDLLTGHLRAELQVLLEQGHAAAQQGLGAGGIAPLLLVWQGADRGAVALGIGADLLGPGPVQALHHDPAHVALGLAELLPDAADGAHGVDILRLGQVHADVLLGGQEDDLVSLGGRGQGADGGAALHVEGQEHAGEHIQSPQGQQRQADDFGCCFAHSLLLSGGVLLSQLLSLRRMVGFSSPLTQAAVMITFCTVGSEGMVYMSSVMTLSITLRRPRAPILRWMALSAMASRAAGSYSSSTPSKRSSA